MISNFLKQEIFSFFYALYAAKKIKEKIKIISDETLVFNEDKKINKTLNALEKLSEKEREEKKLSKRKLEAYS